MPTNHIEGHITSVLADASAEVDFPALALTISGGHTELVLAPSWHEYKLLGATRDDAVGEAFDKAARVLGLPYPGGPEISRLAEVSRNEEETNSYKSRCKIGTPTKASGLKAKNYSLPRPMIDSDNYDFSFSGIKTAVLYMVRDIPEVS